MFVCADIPAFLVKPRNCVSSILHVEGQIACIILPCAMHA